MFMKNRWFLFLIIVLTGCSGQQMDKGKESRIFPDYEGVTIPTNIAPLNFAIRPAQKAVAQFQSNGYAFDVSSSRDGNFIIPEKKWKKLFSGSEGQTIKINILVSQNGNLEKLKSFSMQVAAEPIDPYIAYRLIEPGYALWNEMGIYQRNLESYEQTPIYENKLTGYNCVNCHSFCMQDPSKMLFHLRTKNSGTALVLGDEIEILNTKTDQTISNLTYPSWHPSGRFVAFSTNNVTQDFHPTQRVEVFDKASDVVVYDVETKTIITAPQLFLDTEFETFPTFSPDGKTLYYCSGKSCVVPDSLQSLKYSLCAVSFDPDTKLFGNEVDTIYNANIESKSISFPRVSPDGQFLLCTVSSYGTFPIWHDDADLYMIDLNNRRGCLLENVNSQYADSYHSWASNSRWVIFSSRRLDGLYTRPFIAYVNKNGEVEKPFLLPQKNINSFYVELMKSFNIPEFITGKVPENSYRIAKKAKDRSSLHQVSFKMSN